MSGLDLFAWPAAAPLLLVAPLLWVARLLRDRARVRRLASAIGPRAAVLAGEASPARRSARRALSALALLCAVLALMQPLWGESERPVEQRGLNLVACLDVSRSMLARDMEPDRLGAAQRALRELAGRVRGDRLALVVFAGEARLATPLTHDAPSFADLADLADPLSVARGGTDLGAALSAALAALPENTAAGSAILLLSDGEDLEGRGLRAAAECRARGVVVHCVGFGSTRGSKIAVEGAYGEAFLRDASGQDVVTALDPAGLRRIAEATGGVYLDAAREPGPLVALYDAHLAARDATVYGSEGRRERENRFQWPLLLALLLWVVELGLSERRRA